jgi:AGCS family alanine or glycine:cation symporter
METTIVALLERFNYFFWNHFLFILLVAVGLLYSIILKGVQFRYFFHSFRMTFNQKDLEAEGDISQFQSLMTSLAATIGISSIAGVATALVSGGFGAIFWMWVIAIIGMASKFAEAILAVKFRSIDAFGKMSGGPMYYIEKGMGIKWLAILFALFGTLASFAGGNLIQSNSIAHAISTLTPISPTIVGLVLAFLTFLVLVKGIGAIGKLSSYFVPIMALLYLFSGLWVIGSHFGEIPNVFRMIIKGAFSGQAAVGGFLGASVAAALQYGISRGISSSEAGLGSAPIAAAAAKTSEPGRQALVSMMGTFLSTIVVCSITAFVVGVTGSLGEVGLDGKVLTGVALVMHAFNTTIIHGDILVATSVILFGYSTIIGWAYYGEKCFSYLLKDRGSAFYRTTFCFVVFLGAILNIGLAWPIVDLTNGLMALPNLIALFALAFVVRRESMLFFRKMA